MEELAAARLRLFDAAVAWRTASSRSDGSLATLATTLLGAAGSDSLGGRLVGIAAYGRSSEVDDIHLASCTTPAMIVVPTVAALAHRVGDRPAAAALRAVVCGYEAVTRCAAALGGPRLLSKGIWPSRAVAPIGAAVTAAVLLDLDEDAFADAVGLATGVAFGGTFPEPARELSFAAAVLTGASGAVAASWHCATGAGLDPEWATRISGVPLSDPLVPAPDAPRAVLTTALKPYCGARQALAAATTVSRLVADAGVSPDEIDHVVVGVPTAHRRMVDRPAVTSRLDTLASIQYQVALALLSPDECFDVLRLPARDGGLHTALMGRVEVRADGALDASFPESWGASVSIRAGRRELEATADGVAGEHALDWDLLRGKSARLFRRAGLPARLGEEMAAIASEFTVVGALDALFPPAPAGIGG